MARTLQGREIDMEKLMKANEMMPAIGNMRVNARGDELGSGGKIVRTREDIMSEYYEDPPELWPSPPQVVTPEKPVEVKSTKKSETK